MSKRGWLLSFPLFCLLGADAPRTECGTYLGRAHAEVFLHRQHLARRFRLKLAKATDAAAAQSNQDIGQVAVMDDTGGVVDHRNPFNLDRRTLTFQPVSAGYLAQAGEDSFDAAASSAGTKIDGFADDDTRSLALPFAFPFFGATYRTLWVNSNGYITFTAGDTNASGSFGYFAAGRPAIAPLFTDLDPSQSSEGVRVLAEPGRVVITWARVPLYSSSGLGVPQTFQVRLYPEGRIQIAYSSTDPPDAVVGITPGGSTPVALTDFAGAPAAPVSTGIAEIFARSDAVDIIAAAQKFYQTHEDAYDYLVFYNAEGVAAGPGVVAYESTVRSIGQGYGDTNFDYGAEFGSRRRLQAVLNLGPLSQYPANPNAVVAARFNTGDTPLSILGHEAGHLYLALVSVPNPSDPNGPPPMLGRALAHWAFPFNSDASFLEGNQITDAGASSAPRFATAAAVQRYSALDQYLMGFLPPEEVPPTFTVLNSFQDQGRPPQAGVQFNGNRLDITVDDIVRAAGRRTPDSTVAQRHFRFAIVLIVAAGSTPAPGDVAQVDRYRSEFETFFANAAGGRAAAETSLKRSVTLSLSPAAGVVAGAGGTATIEVATPPASALTFALRAPSNILAAPATVTIPAGGTRLSFQVAGARSGVEEFSAQPSDAAYETALARVQVSPSSAIRLAVVSGDKQVYAPPAPLANPIVIRAIDRNNLPYSGVRVIASVAAGATVQPSSGITGEHGAVSFHWTPAPGTGNQFTAAIDGVPGSAVQVSALGRPVISSIQNGASFGPDIAAGGFVTLKGASLAAGASASANAPFPASLAGVEVLVSGSPAMLYSVSDAQVNFVMPPTIENAEIVVRTRLGVSDPVRVQVNAYAPGIFFDAASGYGAILIAGTGDTTQIHAAPPGAYLEIYCTGLGSGDATPQVQIAGLDAPVLYSGLTSIPGLNQVNVQVPEAVPAGSQTLTLTVNGRSSNTVNVQIALPSAGSSARSEP